MKILSLGHLPSWAGGRQESGLANVIYQLAKYMSDCKGVEVSLVATDVFVAQLQHDNLKIYGWKKEMLVKYILFHPLSAFSWLLKVINAKRKYGPIISVSGFFFKGLHLLRCIKLYKPDAIHLHGMNACVYDMIVPKTVKIIVTMHGLIGKDATIPNQPYLYKMERDICLSKRYSKIVFIADKLIGQFRSLYGTISSPTKVILNAYDSKAFNYVKPQEHDGLVLVTIASLSENKGQKRVIEAIAKLGIRAKYICVGGATGIKVAELTHEAKGHGVDFEYVGKKKPAEIRKILSGADYMILPSSTEGFGLVYLEAIACGVPVILPKHLPIVEEKGIIQPCVNALLLDDSSVNSIAKLLSTLQKYIFDRKRVAASIIGYSWENIAYEYVECYNNI